MDPGVVASNPARGPTGARFPPAGLSPRGGGESGFGAWATRLAPGVGARTADRMRNDFGALGVVSAATGATPTKIRHTLQARVLIRVIGLLQFGARLSQCG